MKIAKIFTGDPDNKKGLFNAVIERTKNLIDVEPNVDCYIIRIVYGFIPRIIKRKNQEPIKEEFSNIDGMLFKNLWVSMGLIDYLLTNRFHRRLFICEKQLNNYIPLFENYDLISSHGTEANFFSMQVKNNFKIPFVATWHGSDINIVPFTSKIKYKISKKLLSAADHNFFVSEKLLETSNKICNKINKSVLYTGLAKSFYRFDKDKKNFFRDKYNIRTSYVVGFVGNLVSIKNVLILPLLFKALEEIIKDISFVVVGDGELNNKLMFEFDNLNINNLIVLGKQEPENIPAIMNILDVLVLPSLNEGLPLVTLEAQACGAYVVGSNRGGIPEAIGEENCFNLDSEFINNLVSRISNLLLNKIEPTVLPTKFSWEEAVCNEMEVYNYIINKKII